MKLRLLTIVVVTIVPGHRGAPALAVTAELCLRPQKNQPQWLASSTSCSASLASRLFFFQRPHFPARLTPFC